MTVSFTIPPHIEQRLVGENLDLNSAAREATLVELYRQERISHGELAQALNLSRLETDALLKRHGVIEDLVTPDELEAQVLKLRELLGP